MMSSKSKTRAKQRRRIRHKEKNRDTGPRGKSIGVVAQRGHRLGLADGTRHDTIDQTQDKEQDA